MGICRGNNGDERGGRKIEEKGEQKIKEINYDLKLIKTNLIETVEIVIN